MELQNGARRTTKICHFINRPGGCRKGANCTFVHPGEPTTIKRSSANNNNNNILSNSDRRPDMVQWRYSIPRDLLRVRPLTTQLTDFLQTALRLVNTEVGVMQDVIKALASDGGLVRLKELLDRDFEDMPDRLAIETTSEQFLPFFKIVTHANVVASVMLEEKIGTIYNFIYGRQGERGVKVFTHVTKVLAISERPDLRTLETLEPVLTAFANMIDTNGHALVNEQLPNIADLLLDICNGLETNITLSLQRLTSKIGRRLGVGRTLKANNTEIKDPQVKLAFVLPQDLPGNLSAAGPRHDNDKQNIKDIEILPTFDEIKAVRPPYLPPRDATQLHLPGIEGLLDRHFRLLREDTVGQLRDAISAELEQTRARNQNAARVNTYDNMTVMNVTFARIKGLQLMVRIDQPQYLRNKSVQQRKDWWEYSSRLKVDALVCIIDRQDSVTFCTVSDLSHSSGVKHDSTGEDPGKQRTMYGEPLHCYLQLQLINPNPATISNFLRQMQNVDTHQRLVEFPGVLLPSFQPTLEALKKMSRRSELPFSEYLAPENGTGPAQNLLAVPLYASRLDFQFDLTAVMTGGSSMKFMPNRDFDIESFKAKCQLDPAQADALLHCLKNSLALIQGPPGTGKSYTGIALIKVLLAIKKKADLGPILCVCYTNHALDQLLEHLANNDVKQIIRMGSRSKSEILEKCNLRYVAQNMPMTGPEKKERWEIIQKLDEEERQIKDLLHTLSRPNTREVIKGYLEAHQPNHHHQLFDSEDQWSDDDENGFQTVHHGRHDEVQQWLHGHRFQDPEHDLVRSIDALQHCHVGTMNRSERKVLHAHWLTEIKSIMEDRLIIAVESHKIKKTQLDRIRHGQDLRCLQEANIVGVTTTGLARQLDLLRNLRSKVLVCEEAGEVLEAHILTALLPSLEHAILIGDHQQLPPHIQNYELSRENARGEQFSLDLSLFERLVAPVDPQQALPFSVLQTQRRMHTSISQLIRSTLYPRLQDSPHVETYPQVAGMKRRLFWLDHRQPEAGSDPTQLATTSHSNDFEIGMVVALVTHLVRQGVYAANEIAVLTPYLGQLHKIRKVLRNQFEITMNERDVQELERQGVTEHDEEDTTKRTQIGKTALLKALAVSTIDNFQGEEAKVVVISLVRSNAQNKCGFLRTPNRINVLLSRAKHGMYIIGNSVTSGHVKMWADVITMLQNDGNFGSQLELECPRHPDTPILVSKPDDFVVFSPEGGCGKKCDKRLNCGHQDHSKCHSDTLHQAVKCLEPCPRQIKGCDHGCPKLCGEVCITNCEVVLNNLNVKLNCGHTKTTLTCWQSQHPEIVRCQTIVEKTMPGCEHKITVNCCVDVSGNKFQCRAICGAVLGCGHLCSKQCHDCTIRRDGVVVSANHGACKKICGRKLNSCNHNCKLECHGDTPCKCTAKCENFCEHSKCAKQCEEPCPPCAEMSCASGRCPHSTPCSMPCAAPCDWLPCAKRCSNILICGHQCPTVCGEVCPPPQLCQICADEETKQIVVDYIMYSTYGEVNLDDDPCVIPACGHILTISSMDGQMEMAKHYVMEENVVTGIQQNSEPFSMDELKVCATCRSSLRNIARYGRIVRRALLDESTKKFIRSAGLTTIDLSSALNQEQQSLSSSIAEASAAVVNKDDKMIKLTKTMAAKIQVIHEQGGSRYKKLKHIQTQIIHHLSRVRKGEQPYMRVWELVKFAQRSKSNVGSMTMDTSVLQTRETVQATSLLMRCNLAILSDFLKLKKMCKFEIDFSEERANCDKLVDMALRANQPLHAVEGHVYFVQFAAAEVSHIKNDDTEELLAEAKTHIADARAICARYPEPTRYVVADLDLAEQMLRDFAFYMPMRQDEWKEVMSAMQREFRGSGHWYTCENGHPFTIGECGGAMQLSKCPQCEAPIGGQHHRTAPGVRRANDLERDFGGLHL